MSIGAQWSKPEVRHAYLTSMRLERWPRSLSIFTGSLLALTLIPVRPELEHLLLGLVALLAAFAVATFNYIVNGITDAPYDHHHPDKRNRPLVAHRLSTRVLAAAAIVWLAVGLLFGRTLHPGVFSSLVLLSVAGMVYNVPPVRAKDIPYLDALVESVNNPIRLSIGWYALRVTQYPPWTLLLAWWAFGAYLMYAKRLSEKRYLTPTQAVQYRRSLTRYSQSGLKVMIGASGLVVLAALGVFAQLYGSPRVWVLLPFVVLYFLWIYYETISGSGRVEEPEALFRRPVFVIMTIALTAALLWSVWVQ